MSFELARKSVDVMEHVMEHVSEHVMDVKVNTQDRPHTRNMALSRHITRCFYTYACQMTSYRGGDVGDQSA
jgi:hypothetical protein